MRKSLIVVGIGLVLSAEMAGTPAFAQNPTAPLDEAMALCNAAIAEGPLGAAANALNDARWTVEYATNVGPAAQMLRASSRSPDLDRYFLAETASAGGVFRLRCAIDWEGTLAAIDLAAFAATNGFEGAVTPLLDGGDYGLWSMPLDEGLAVYSVIQREGYLAFQLTWVEWGAPRG